VLPIHVDLGRVPLSALGRLAHPVGMNSFTAISPRGEFTAVAAARTAPYGDATARCAMTAPARATFA
jgi:hypothetical protein